MRDNTAVLNFEFAMLLNRGSLNYLSTGTRKKETSDDHSFQDLRRTYFKLHQYARFVGY